MGKLPPRPQMRVMTGFYNECYEVQILTDIKINNYEIDLFEVLRLLKKKMIFIIIAGVLSGAAGFYVTNRFMVPEYESSATMIVNTRIDQNSMVTNDQITSAENLVDTYAIIIQSGRVLNPVIDKLKLNTNYNVLQQKITVSQINDTQVMRIAVRDPDPDKAFRIIKEIVNTAPDIIIDTVEAGSVKTIERPTVTAFPVTPNVKMNVFLSFVIGIIVSIFFVIVKLMMDNTIKSENDIQIYLELPVLGVIPNVKKLHNLFQRR